MVARVETVAFQGVEARPVDVQVHMAGGMPTFTVVGLGDKAVAESRERVRAALHAIGLGLPPKRITVNLAPADMPKEGSHYDLPIALGLLVVMGVMSQTDLDKFIVIGELSLDGQINAVAGALPAAMAANARGRGLICPEACGPEAAWAGMDEANVGGILAPRSIIALVNHFKGILPPLSPREMLDVSMIASIAGVLQAQGMGRARAFRAPHHSASMAALVGGGLKAKPGEVSLAHRGVLFLDELPEFPGIR